MRIVGLAILLLPTTARASASGTISFAPSSPVVAGGVLWDADGNNLTRKQVEGIEGVIPTARIGSVPDVAHQQ